MLRKIVNAAPLVLVGTTALGLALDLAQVASGGTTISVWAGVGRDVQLMLAYWWVDIAIKEDKL